MRHISSWATTFQQIYPSVSGVGLVLLWIVAAVMTGSTAFWIVAVAFAMLVLLLLRIAPKVRHIALDGNDICVSSTFRSLRLPLSSVVSVTERPGGGFHWATIEFNRETPFGRHVHFIPNICYERLGFCRWRRIAPVLEELARIANAQFVCEGRPTPHG